ncbi:MAG: tRNA preQ1(34) S-adenosylmethionine ribosyltransferase-isomerase QueA [Candidatus Tyrphobacter sp.]
MDERLAACYEYDLPPALIAQEPAARREDARLLVVGDDALEDRTVAELPRLLRPGDLVVLNETRVLAARLYARRRSGGRVEILLLHPAGGSMRYDPNAASWIALVRPAKRVGEGERLELVSRGGDGAGAAVVVAALDHGVRELRFELDVPFEEMLGRVGRLALPPYIHNESDDAQERYQTVFARVPGSVAAPTASLHVTGRLLAALGAHGIEIVKLALDVGLGTFRPMQAQRIDEHVMHAERYTISPQSVQAIERARSSGRRVVAIGTTVVRALEGNVGEHGALCAGEFETALFITPGFRFRVVDAMMTNFHLPRSTLLVLVSAFAGRERILHAYRAAIERGYRFFSFGDAMLLERERSAR